MRRKVLATGILCGALSMACLGSIQVAAAPETQVCEETAENTSEIQPRSEEIVWVIRKINGKWYRRLFNTTTGEYIGDWIPCP